VRGEWLGGEGRKGGEEEEVESWGGWEREDDDVALRGDDVVLRGVGELR
jgi:hypothetical protein